MMRTIGALLLLFSFAGLVLAQDPPPADDPPPAQPDQPDQPEPPAAPEADPEAEAKALAGVEHFPLDVGRRWSYRVRFSIEPAEGGAKDKPVTDPGEGEHQLDVYVTDPVKLGDKQVAALEWKLDQALAQRSYFRVEGDFLLCLKRLQGSSEHVKEFTLNPPQQFIPAKLEVGAEWTWKGKSGPGAGTQTFKALRLEDVELPAGKFKALVLESTFEGEDDSRGKTTRWLAPGIGIVKEISEVRTPKQVFRSQGVLVKFEKP